MGAGGKLAAGFGMATAAAIGLKELAIAPKLVEMGAGLKATTSIAHEVPGLGNLAADTGRGFDYSALGAHYHQTNPNFNGPTETGFAGDFYGSAGYHPHLDDSILAPHAPLRAANLDAWATAHHAGDQFSKLSDSATPDITRDLSQNRQHLTVEYAQKVIEKDLISTIEAQPRDTWLTFEAATGKLKVDASMQMGGFKLAFGEVNVYKVAGIAAVGAAACKSLNAPEFQACVKTALDKAFGEELGFRRNSLLKE